jgi:hypothetical protein
MSLSVGVNVARRIGNVARCVYWLCAMLFCLTFDGCTQTGPPSVDRYFAADMALFAILGLLALAVRLATIKFSQTQKQRECERILAGDSNRPVVLFLRSFVIAESSLTSKALMNFWNLLDGLMKERGYAIDVENELDAAIGDQAVFVAIGDKYVSYGSAKLAVSDDKWQEWYFRLAQSAKLIVMMPGPSASTIWEMSQILNSTEALEKSVFIMLPAKNVRLSDRVQESWAATAKLVFENYGVRLPKYRQNGCCFRLNHSHEVIKLAEIEPFMEELSNSFSAIVPRAITSGDRVIPNRC